LPKAQSLPQRHSHGLYPERISGTAFTAKRSVNKQTFLYRILPSTAQSSWTHLNSHALNHDLRTELQFLPDQFVWPPFKVNQSCTFLDGLSLIGGAGDPTMKNGVAYYSYTCGVDMSQETACYDADGDMLIGEFWKMLL
jgi:homogentisate 1,2-dioxygenase